MSRAGPRITVVNRQRVLKLRTDRLAALARFLLDQVRPADPAGTWDELNVLVLDDAGIREANRACFNKDRPTDVISLAYPPGFGQAGWSGEVLINAERAIAEGWRPGGPERELALYLAHGCDHLSGADDHTPADRARMRRRENGWLRAAVQKGLLRTPSARRRTSGPRA